MNEGAPCLYLIIGESGAGKDSIVDYICENYGMTKVISKTTREPRYDGEDTHEFISMREFERLHDSDQLVAETEFDGHSYGATLEDVGMADFYIIDPQGAQRFKYHKVDRPKELIFITADEDVRRQRMEMRGDNEFHIDRRLRHDQTAFDATYYPILLSSYIFDTSDERPVSYYGEKLYSYILSRRRE